MQQYGRVGRNGMSPIREMCTASKLFFSLFWKFLRICAEQLQRSGKKKKKKLSIFKRPVTVKSTWIGKGESSAVNNIYNIVPGACENSGSKFCTGARGFVTSFTSSRSQVQLPWQECCVRAEEVSLPVITKGLV